NRQLNALNRHTSCNLVNAVQNEVHLVLKSSESLMEAEEKTLIEQAKQESDNALTHELSSLEAIRYVNPNIRDDEVEA
ncbi:hypothetical protein, partial [Proteus mirabilis]|uniref:hypothetical protein n=1 Tax=Proteus mirabilis TaxID=584 RepID=UPI00257A14E5